MIDLFVKYTQYNEEKKDNISDVLGIDDIDYYSGGKIEHLERRVENLILTVEKLVAALVLNSSLSKDDLIFLSRHFYLSDVDFDVFEKSNND